MRNIGFGLLAVMIMLPVTYAQRQQQSDRGESGSRPEPAQRSELSRAPVEHSPVMVDRSNHGSIRHVDTHVVERPVDARHNVEVHRPVEVQHAVQERHDVDVRQNTITHRDVEVDVNRLHFWHGFVFGARLHGLRVGYRRLFVNNAAFFYDDGIYYQQVGADYQEVYPPVGAVITELPDGAIEVEDGDHRYYYAGGAFYVQQDGEFLIVDTPLGVIVPELPPGIMQVSAGNGVLYQFNDVYYQPVFFNGVTQYRTLRR